MVFYFFSGEAGRVCMPVTTNQCSGNIKQLDEKTDKLVLLALYDDLSVHYQHIEKMIL